MNYHQDQDEDQDQDEASSTPPYEPLGLGVSSEPSWLDIALDEYERGNLQPLDVKLGPMPPRAGKVMRAIAEHMRLLMGLRLALGEDRPLPYACSLPVRFRLVEDKAAAHKALRSLVQFGVVRDAGVMMPIGVKLYAPPEEE